MLHLPFIDLPFKKCPIPNLSSSISLHNNAGRLHTYSSWGGLWGLKVCLDKNPVAKARFALSIRGLPGNFRWSLGNFCGEPLDVADWNLSSTELESGNALKAFLQTPAPVLDKISGPMGTRFLSSTGLGSGNLTERERAQILPSTGTG